MSDGAQFLSMVAMVCVVVGAGTLLAAADAGDWRGPANRDKTYASGIRVAQSEIDTYRAAAETGNTAAMVHLGAIYAEGLRGMPVDGNEGARWYRKAAEAGNANGMFCLGIHLWLNDQNSAEARSWFERAAVAGNSDAMVELGNQHERKAFERPLDKMSDAGEFQQARSWYEKAAAGGNLDGAAALKKLEQRRENPLSLTGTDTSWHHSHQTSCR
jgi:TPR repeat protein